MIHDVVGWHPTYLVSRSFAPTAGIIRLMNDAHPRNASLNSLLPRGAAWEFRWMDIVHQIIRQFTMLKSRCQSNDDKFTMLKSRCQTLASWTLANTGERLAKTRRTLGSGGRKPYLSHSFFPFSEKIVFQNWKNWNKIRKRIFLPLWVQFFLFLFRKSHVSLFQNRNRASSPADTFKTSLNAIIFPS